MVNFWISSTSTEWICTSESHVCRWITDVNFYSLPRELSDLSFIMSIRHVHWVWLIARIWGKRDFGLLCQICVQSKLLSWVLPEDSYGFVEGLDGKFKRAIKTRWKHFFIVLGSHRTSYLVGKALRTTAYCLAFRPKIAILHDLCDIHFDYTTGAAPTITGCLDCRIVTENIFQLSFCGCRSSEMHEQSLFSQISRQEFASLIFHSLNDTQACGWDGFIGYQGFLLVNSSGTSIASSSCVLLHSNIFWLFMYVDWNCSNCHPHSLHPPFSTSYQIAKFIFVS